RLKNGRVARQDWPGRESIDPCRRGRDYFPLDERKHCRIKLVHSLSNRECSRGLDSHTAAETKVASLGKVYEERTKELSTKARAKDAKPPSVLLRLRHFFGSSTPD